MHVFRGCPRPSDRQPTALAIGNFDGVHLGHQALLRDVVEAARDRGLVASALTFEPHPREVLRGETHTRLSTLYDKVLRILATGIERVYILPFHASLHTLSPEAFVTDILKTRLDTRWLTVGEDFRFGAKGAGDVKRLHELCADIGCETYIAPDYMHNGVRISSSLIREALAQNDLFEAETMMGHPYTMTGRVIHGRALGRTLGFPTLNLAPIPPGSKARPATDGIFAVKVHGLTDGPLPGVASLGVKPTITAEKRYLLETHLFDWAGDAYGRVVQVEFVKRLRGEKKFSGLEELTAAIANDARQARTILGLAPEKTDA